MRAARIVVATVMLVLVLAACGEPTGSPPDPTVEPGGGGETASERDVQIYSAVIHQVIEVDNTFGGTGKPIPFDHVLIDTAIGSERSGMGDEEGAGGAWEPRQMSPELQEALAAELSDLPDVRFVDGAEAVNKQEGGLKMERAALISLAPIPDGEEKIELPVGMLCGSLCGAWMTYVVVNDGGWEVRGTTGPIGIS